MSEQDVRSILGRVVDDPAFAARLQQVVAQGGDLAQQLALEGFQLPPEEVQRIAGWIAGAPAPLLQARLGSANVDLLVFQAQRARDLQTYTLNLFKGTLDSARKTYLDITWMNRIMFAVGIGLFVAAAVYSAVAEKKIYGLLFGGLGTIAFIGFFLLGPIKKSQTALSNLVQAEVAFMDFYEQITVWEAFALSGVAPGGDSARVEKGSKMLQQRARETIELLERYLEEKAEAEK